MMATTGSASTPDAAAIQAAAELLLQADALLVTAGAGMGVDSGLPDFRGNQGFWRAYPALGQRGLSFAEVASPFSFDTDPALAWGFYGHRLALYRRTVPHAGFHILHAWGQRLPQGLGVFTSNVDGHFQRAGFDTARLVECHGAIHRLQCTQPCHSSVWPADDFLPEVDEVACRLLNAPPRCPRCGALARPHILMFNDGAWLEQHSLAQLSRLQHWLTGCQRPLVVELGAGTAIPSVRHFGQQVLSHHGGRLLRINPHEAAVPGSLHVGIAGPALATLRAIDAALQAL